MRVERDWLRNLVFATGDDRRFTQDSPIMPDVWLIAGMFFCRDADVRVDFLLTPYKDVTPERLAAELQRRLEQSPLPSPDASHRPMGVNKEQTLVWTDGRPARRVELRRRRDIAVNQTAVVAALTLREIITCAMPLSPWWQRNLSLKDEPASTSPPDDSFETGRIAERHRNEEIAWFRRVVGVLMLCGHMRQADAKDLARDEAAPAYMSADEAQRLRRATRLDAQRFAAAMQDAKGQAREFNALLDMAAPARGEPLLWKINLNRSAFLSISRSVPTTKADAARRVFNVNCSKLCWAVVDSGIDATHRAFWDESRRCRVVRAYDFTKLRELISQRAANAGLSSGANSEHEERAAKRYREKVRGGAFFDWERLLPQVTIKPGAVGSDNDHGTHVAGIIGARGLEGHAEYGEGMCPDIQLCDVRVLNGQGRGDEFTIIAALQFIRYLNANSDRPVIHGVNLSLSLLHDVENYACGRTPICEECERLVNSGVVVVAAAGNRGYEHVLTALGGELEGYRGISITDPGNGEAVITVGSTHRFEPHTYGTSYFSSRGPTGDGRIKPDVLAPGEKIQSTIPGNYYASKDGTSMAAPHVSGVAALLMARYSEFIGRPAEIKKIICGSATDLRRERYFQGAGLVDALRALQSV